MTKIVYICLTDIINILQIRHLFYQKHGKIGMSGEVYDKK